jgi:hypothetical protein
MLRFGFLGLWTLLDCVDFVKLRVRDSGFFELGDLVIAVPTCSLAAAA